MPAGVSAITPLANVTLGSNASTVTFSSISQSYRDLILVTLHNPANSVTLPFIRFNSDSASNYTWNLTRGDGGSTYSATFFGSYIGIADYSVNYANTITHIYDYSATDKHKTAISRASQWLGGGYITMNAGRWANTSAITTLSVHRSDGDQFAAGSTFALYGVSSS